tara:strand:- start:134 stop:316 length:183 start_codon:yes stop_codon:yes gene_type:complete
VKLNEEQKSEIGQYGINQLKKNMTTDNAKAAGKFAWNNSKLVAGFAGSMAKGAINNYKQD